MIVINLLYYIILVIRIILSQSRMQSAPTMPIKGKHVPTNKDANPCPEFGHG
jgi:hypothetical protein